MEPRFFGNKVKVNSEPSEEDYNRTTQFGPNKSRKLYFTL
jgi:hypothetical protein